MTESSIPPNEPGPLDANQDHALNLTLSHSGNRKTATDVKLYCPIRGQLKISAKAKDQLTPTEEKLRIDCIRFLLKKKYPKANFKIETVLLRFGSGGRNSFRTDLVVFDCPASELLGVPIEKAKEHVVLVAEIKRDNADAAEAKQMQVEPAMAFLPDSSAIGVYWDDIEQRLFYFVQEGNKRRLKEAPINKLPDFGNELNSTVLAFADLQPARNLLKLFRQLEDILHAQVVDKSKRFMVLLQLLLLKLYDEQTHEITPTNALDLQDFSVSTAKDASIRDRMDSALSKAVKFYGKYLPEKVDSEFSIDGSLLRRVSKLLAPINVLKSKHDVIQDFYMYFAKGLYKWELAQYFTPTEVVDCVVDVLNPQQGEHIKDPACGSADFLISAFRFAAQHLWNAAHSIWGADNSSQAVQVSILNMVLNGDGKSNIKLEDSLEHVKRDDSKYDVLLCNPPFGTRIKETRETVLRKFELGYEWIMTKSGWKQTESVLDSQETGILFAELCVSQVSIGGRVGIVVPNGYLGNRSNRYTVFREWLLRHARVVSIVSLPRFTFKKSGADVSASLLFLERMATPLTDSGKVEAYEFHVGVVTSVGWTVVKRPERIYAREAETGAILMDQNNEPVVDADFTDVLADLYRSSATNYFPWLLEGKDVIAGEPGWSVSISVPLADSDRVLDPKRLNRKFANIRAAITNVPYFKLGDVVDIIPESRRKIEPSKTYKYVQIQDIWDGGYTSSSLKGWQLPSRARHRASPGDIFAGKIWHSVGKWIRAGGNTDDLIVTNGCYRLRIKPEKKDLLPDLVFGMCSEAYRVQMRGFATGSDGLAEIVEADCSEVILPKIKTDEARESARRHLALYAEGHATLKSYVTEVERSGAENIPYVPDRKTVFVQV